MGKLIWGPGKQVDFSYLLAREKCPKYIIPHPWFMETFLLSFYCLSNVEFNSLINLRNWFNCLLLLMHIHEKI